MNKKDNVFWLGVLFILHIVWALSYGILFWALPTISKLFK
jgi:hypothetical protein